MIDDEVIADHGDAQFLFFARAKAINHFLFLATLFRSRDGFNGQSVGCPFLHFGGNFFCSLN
jgi:hypothetical protein